MHTIVESTQSLVRRWAQEYGKNLRDMFEFYSVVEFLEMCGLQNATVADVNGDAMKYAFYQGVTFIEFIENNADQIFSDFEVEEAMKDEIAGEAVARDEAVHQAVKEEDENA